MTKGPSIHTQYRSKRIRNVDEIGTKPASLLRRTMTNFWGVVGESSSAAAWLPEIFGVHSSERVRKC